MNTWIKEILESDLRIAIPIMTHPGIETIGKNVIDAVTDGDVHFQAINSATETYDTTACTVIMDLTVEAEAFGCAIHFPEHEVPSVTGRLVYDEDSVNRLQVPPLTVGRVPEYLKANRLAVEKIRNKPVLSGCIGPFSLAGRLYDMSEPAAGLLSGEDCQMYSSIYVKQIVEAVQDDTFVVILHNCGNTGQCTEAMIETGAAALHFGNAINMEETLKLCPEDIVVMGNIDPVGILKQADAATVYRITAGLLEKTAMYKNFVISSGCDMPPLVPAENIKAFYQAVSDFNTK